MLLTSPCQGEVAASSSMRRVRVQIPNSGATNEESQSALREMLATPETIVAPFVFDRLQAKLAVSAGFDAVYMTGFGTAAARISRPRPANDDRDGRRRSRNLAICKCSGHLRRRYRLPRASSASEPDQTCSKISCTCWESKSTKPSKKIRRLKTYTSLNSRFFCDASIAACAAASRATGIRNGEHDT